MNFNLVSCVLEFNLTEQRSIIDIANAKDPYDETGLDETPRDQRSIKNAIKMP